MKTLVVALGATPLLQRGEALTAENQYRNIASAVPALARPGPFLSAGDCSRQRAAGGAAGIAESGVERGRTVSAGCAGGRKSGMIGYMLAQSLSAQPQMPPVTTVLTRIEVSP